MELLQDGNYKCSFEDLCFLADRIIEKRSKDNEILYKVDIMKDLKLSRSRFAELIKHPNFPMDKISGSGSRMQIKRVDLEAWKSDKVKGYGRFNY